MAQRPSKKPAAKKEPLRILFVEDCMADAELCLHELRKAGCEVRADIVTTRKQFADQLRSTSYDVILSDYRLPDWSGFDALEYLQQQGTDIPFILVTGTLGEETAAECIKRGGADYVLKDRLARLPLAIRHALQEKTVREERRRAAKQLEERTVHLNALIENNPLGIVVLDGSHQVQMCNAAFERLFRYSAAELVGTRLDELISPIELRPEAVEFTRQVLSGQMVHATTQRRRKDGAVLDLELQGIPLVVRDRVIGVYGIYEDVTERKRANTALQESQTRLELLNSISARMISGMSTEQLIARTVQALAGYFPTFRVTFGTLDSAGTLTVIHSCEPTGMDSLAGAAIDLSVAPDYWAALRTLEPVIVEDDTQDPRMAPLLGLCTARGTRALLEVPLEYPGPGLGLLCFAAAEPRRWSEHEIATSMEIAEYLSIAIKNARTEEERKRAEEVLRETSQNLKAVIETSPLPIMALDPDGKVKMWNRAAERIFSWSEKEVLGRPLPIVPSGKEEEHRRFRERVLRGETLAGVEIRRQRKDGTLIDLSLSTALLRNPDGTASGIMAVLADITERKRAEDALREAEERYRSIFENAIEGIFQTTPEGRFLSANPAVARMYGYDSPEELIRSVTDIEKQLYVEPKLRQQFQRCMETEGVLRDFEYQVRRKDGSRMWISENARAVKDESGTILYYEGTCEDITRRKQAEEALSHLAFIVESSHDAIIGMTPQGTILSWNPGAERLYGYSAEEIKGQPISCLLPPDRLDEVKDIFERIQEGEQVAHFETVRVAKGGKLVDISLTISPIRDLAGRIVGASSIARDITERKRLEAELVHLANHDPLTDLFNRRHFQDELERQLAEAHRYGTQAALLFLDLDQFKDINDTLGHLAGDELLISLARVLRERLRQTDIVARPGGDEFAILLPHTNAERARAVGEQLLEAVRRHTILLGRQLVGVTASLGVVLVPDHGATVGELFARADLALYQAKESGRNCVAVYAPERDAQAKVEVRLGWQKRIREALEKDLFRLEAQPVLHLGSNQVSQYELLLRLIGERGEVVLPGAFLDIAERFGLMHAIDRWVVRQAIRLIAAHQQNGQELRLEVNLSGKALADAELLPLIERELSETSIRPANLVLEVTETTAIANIHQAQKFVHTLKALGCQFALDDFGVGFSSFYYLKHLPVDYLKLDGSFVRNLARDPLDQHLVQAMVAVARGLGQETIAEFVGDEETIGLLRKYGVSYAQGFYIGRPCAVLELLKVS